MSARGSPIRGLEADVREFTLESYSLNAENQRLTQLLIAKNNQIRTLVYNNTHIKSTYEAQATAYRKTMDSLQKRLRESEGDREAEYQRIKEEYDCFKKDEVSSLRNEHTSETEFLFKEIAHLRATLETEHSKIQVREHEIVTLRESYERELALNSSEINSLSKKIMLLQQQKQREIRELTSKRELERSRTSGLLNSKKESNQYIEKQLRKLNEDILDKTIALQNANRELAKERKRHEDTARTMAHRLQTNTREYEAQLAEKEQYFAKIEQILKEEILEYKQKQIRLMSEKESLQSAANLHKKEVDSKEAVIRAKTEENFSLKNSIETMREEHINEINSLMKERRKRSSKSNMGSSRSLTSSMKDSAVAAGNGQHTPDPENFSGKLASFLPIVKEESSPERKDFSHQLSQSNMVEQNEDQLARAILHYDCIIEELKKSHEMELQYYKINLEGSSSKLREKELELEDVLTRFSPLVKIHAEQKSLEEDRKERIERHWKADLGVLDIMLNKYKIRAF